MLSKFTYVAWCRSIQLLVLLARGDATKDLERRCCIAPPRRTEAATSARDQTANASSSNATATRRFTGSSIANS